MPLSCLVPYVPATASLAIISLVTFAHMGWKTNLTTITNDIYPVQVVGSVSGVIAFGSGIGGTLFTSLAGQLAQRDAYALIFIIMAFLHPAAWIIVRMAGARNRCSIRCRGTNRCTPRRLKIQRCSLTAWTSRNQVY